MCVHVMLYKIINVKRCVGLCMFVCVCKHSRMASFMLLFPTMCEYCPPTNRCDHVRVVARGGFEGFDRTPLWVGGGGGGEEEKKIIIFLSSSTHVHTTKSQSVRILPCSVLKCIRLSGALHDLLLL